MYALLVSYDYTSPTDTLYHLMLSVGFLFSISSRTETKTTTTTGYGGSTFIIMSIESGVGVACGCLPGCKPMMNKMFPRIFANSSHPSSYPRRSAHFRARKGVQEFSSGARSEQMSYNQKEEDPSAMEKAIRRDTPSTHQAMATSKSLPLHPGIRPPSRAAFPGGRREGYSELDNESEDSPKFPEILGSEI